MWRDYGTVCDYSYLYLLTLILLSSLFGNLSLFTVGVILMDNTLSGCYINSTECIAYYLRLVVGIGYSGIRLLQMMP